jgi:hypothetical protein
METKFIYRNSNNFNYNNFNYNNRINFRNKIINIKIVLSMLKNLNEKKFIVIICFIFFNLIIYLDKYIFLAKLMVSNNFYIYNIYVDLRK